MLQTEFIRSLHCNYERVLLDKKPEEKRYQYCILSRGGIKGLLPCSLRYINGLAYLYYDITSKQNMAQLYTGRTVGREWLKDFVWSVKRIRQALERFLLDEKNLLWYPDQIYQDLENNVFSFLYVPYYTGEESFVKLLEYLVEHIDYEDDALVECVYKMYEQWEKCGMDYLQEQLYEDVKVLEGDKSQKKEMQEKPLQKEQQEGIPEPEEVEKIPETATEVRPEKKAGIFSFLDMRKRKGQEAKETYQESMQRVMSGYAVAEENLYQEENYGRTVYIEENGEQKSVIHGLYYPEGKALGLLVNTQITIGKKKEEVNLVLEDASVSRMHARVIKDNDQFYLEDLNSTNGTYKNGLRMQPYEKRKLEPEDEIRFGKVSFEE